MIILLLGAGLSYGLYVNLSKSYELNSFDLVLVALPFIIAVAFAFLKIHGITLFKFILLLIEQSFFRASQRRWIQNAGTPFVSMTLPFTMKAKKKEKIIPEKNVSSEKIKNLAKVLDGEKSDFKKTKPA
ncbi:MAG: PrgI family protein [Candidatus Peregrinibacteria bacterium]|nr:PrgI family protein [Candidatus Peregrinibacteria bacterium]